MRERPHLTVAAVVEAGGRFLLVEEEIAGRRLLNQPAGHVENGERPAAAVRREVLEETGRRFEPTALVGVYHYTAAAQDQAFLRLCYTGRLLGPELDAPADPAILRVLWLSAAELAAERPRHRSPLVARCVQDYLAGARLPLALVQEL